MGSDKWFLTKTETFKAGEGDGARWKKGETAWEFEDFREARDAFRGLARECATTEGNVFDGDGNIRGLREHFERIRAWLDEKGPLDEGRWVSSLLREVPDYSFMAGDFDSAKAMPSALRAWLLDMGAHSRNPLPEFRWTDWALGVVSKPGSLAMGCVSGFDRIELYDSQLYADCFDMEDPRRDYEFSVRAGFGSYATGAGSLRIRLSGEPGGGLFPWPEDDRTWPCNAAARGAAPCLGGEIDGETHIRIEVNARGGGGGDEQAERLAGGHAGFVEGVIGAAEALGYAVDKRMWMPQGGEDGGTSRIDCYLAGGPGTWSLLVVNVDYDPRDPEPIGPPEGFKLPEGWKHPEATRPPIRVAGERFHDYGPALVAVSRMIGDHLERTRGPKG